MFAHDHHHHAGQHSYIFKIHRKCQRVIAHSLHWPDETYLIVLVSVCRSAAGKRNTEHSSTHAIDYYKNINNVVSDPITQNSIWAVTLSKANTFVNSVMRKNETRALPDNPVLKSSTRYEHHYSLGTTAPSHSQTLCTNPIYLSLSSTEEILVYLKK